MGKLPASVLLATDRIERLDLDVEDSLDVGDWMCGVDGPDKFEMSAVRTAGSVVAVGKVVWTERLLKRTSAAMALVAVTEMMVVLVRRVEVIDSSEAWKVRVR